MMGYFEELVISGSLPSEEWELGKGWHVILQFCFSSLWIQLPSLMFLDWLR